MLQSGAMTAAAHADATDELKRRVNEEDGAAPPLARGADKQQKLLAAVLTLVVPLVAAGIYYHAGSPAALVVAHPKAEIQQPQHEVSAADVSTLVQGLSDRLRENPGDADGWYMLARSYTAIGRYQDASTAYQRLLVLVPDDSAVLADYADVLATLQGGTLAGEPEKLILQALKHNPQDIKALALAGNAAFQRSDLAVARKYWEQLLPLVPEDSPIYQGTLASLAQVKGGGDAKSGAVPEKLEQTGPAGLTGVVTLSPALLATVKPSDPVFIFARAASGPRTPLAVQRIMASQLPYKFALDDAQAMSPDLKLSTVSQVVVTARISRSGTPTAAKGDMEGQTGVISSRTQDIRLHIDNIIE
jgi:cytochrome c-type biogenesis protein CcmH